MPAKEKRIAERSADGPSPTHTWLVRKGRRLEIESGKPLIHRFCTTCRRNFLNDVSSGEWYAVFPRIFDFERLDHVSERWLSEACPGRHLALDEETRKLLQNGKVGPPRSENG